MESNNAKLLQAKYSFPKFMYFISSILFHIHSKILDEIV